MGSLEKKDHKPGGGDKKVETHKLTFKDKAEAKVGSKDNIKHKAGGGDVEVSFYSIQISTHSTLFILYTIIHGFFFLHKL